MTNATTMLRLELDQCDPHTLGFLWGLTSSVSKDDGGNLLLARLSQRFEREYAARTGKVVTVTNLPTQNSFDLEGYSIQDLRKAYAHFSCLTAAFESNAKRSSSRFCKLIMDCIAAALDTHSCNAGHA